MQVFLNRLITVFFVVFFFTTTCMDGAFRGTGEAEVHGILAATNNYVNLHHNRRYLGGALYHGPTVEDVREADIEFTRDAGFFVVEVKSSQVGIGALGMTVGRYVTEQLPKQVIAYPVGTTIKVVLDIRVLNLTPAQCLTLEGMVTAGGTIIPANVGFLRAPPGGVLQLTDRANAPWMP